MRKGVGVNLVTLTTDDCDLGASIILALFFFIYNFKNDKPRKGEVLVGDKGRA